ncbi:MAG TPA: class IV adenylate cyclase [Thermoanaerobaculia bacterium]
MSPTVENGRRLEIEVKLPATDLASLRGVLRVAGARPVTPLHSESNDLYDGGDGQLGSRGSTLRLRRTDHGSTLTFKGPARFEGGTKIREERETAVADPDSMERILTALGLERRFRYEKRREEWELNDCTIALDETPIGNFVEIEGDPPAIRGALQRLGLDFSEAIPYTYAELYRRRRREDPSLPKDMVFPAEDR